MKIIIRLWLASALLGIGYVRAEVADVAIWEPYPGRSAELFATAQEGRAILSELGFGIFVGVDQWGNLHFASGADTWEEWGKLQTKGAQSAEWQAFVQSFLSDPSAKQVGSFHIDSPLSAESRGVSIVYSWDVQPGKTAQFLESAEQAAAIHTKLGASVGIHVDDLGDVHYEMTFDDWAAWGRFSAAQAASEEWNAFFSSVMDSPTGELVRVYRIDDIPASEE